MGTRSRGGAARATTRQRRQNAQHGDTGNRRMGLRALPRRLHLQIDVRVRVEGFGIRGGPPPPLPVPGKTQFGGLQRYDRPTGRPLIPFAVGRADPCRGISIPPTVNSSGFQSLMTWEYGSPTQAVARKFGASGRHGAGLKNSTSVGSYWHVRSWARTGRASESTATRASRRRAVDIPNS